MANIYPKPGAVNPHQRMPRIVVPAGHTGLNSGSVPVARQAVAVKSFLTRKPQN
jgi:hypothetical protein